MKMIQKLSMLILVVISSALIWNCEGPAGKDGKPGVDGNATCGQCHSDTTSVNLMFSQYEFSKHNKGEVFDEEGGRANCASCHTGDGFVQGIKTGSPSTANGASKISCKACHTIHDKYGKEDFALRVTAPVKLQISGETVDFKTGNLCATCHQGRSFVQPDSAENFVFKTTGATTYNRYGPHYGTAANVYAMKGLFNVEGSESIPTSNPHANFAQGCVTCHMAKKTNNNFVGGHTFAMPAAQMDEIAACKNCHTEEKFLKEFPKSTQIAAMLKETRDSLLSKGFLDISQTNGAEGYQILGEYLAQSKTGVKFTKQQLQVTLNYLYIAKDRSMGAHNPKYVYALVKNGLEALKK